MEGIKRGIAQRFGGFALGHFGLSLGCSALLFIAVMLGAAAPEVPAFSGLWGLWGAWLLAAVLMAAYIPVGYWMARARGWPRAEGRENLLAVLLPALIAWAWGGLGTGLLCLDGRPAAIQGAWILVGGAFFLAMPSWYFMALCVFCGAMGPLPYGGNWMLPLCLFLAGLLPPLLFHLGAQMAARTRPPAGPDGEGGDSA